MYVHEPSISDHCSSITPLYPLVYPVDIVNALRDKLVI